MQVTDKTRVMYAQFIKYVCAISLNMYTFPV